MYELGEVTPQDYGVRFLKEIVRSPNEMMNGCYLKLYTLPD